MTKNKTTIAIALLLMFTMAFSFVALPIVNTAKAAFTWFPYLTASPNPVGVGQRVLVVFGFTMPTGSNEGSYLDWTLTITDPDGNAETATGLDTETTGSTFYVFSPDQAGTWKIKAHYPGGNVLLGFMGVSWSVPAADTNEFSLTVQEDQIPDISNTPLPSAYWEFPIYGENQAWNQIAGNWLMSGYDSERDFDAGAGAFNPYTTVPNSAHILWTKAQLLGGIVGGDTSMTYYTGESYRRELIPPVIINGRMYYNVREPPAYGFKCVDLATGETLWSNNGTYLGSDGAVISGRAAGLTFGQVLTLDTPNWHGGMPLLWSVGDISWGVPTSTWAVWNAYDGSLLYTIANVQTPFIYGVPYGSFMFENKTGTLLSVVFDPYSDRLILWNSTKMFDETVGIGGFYSAGPQYNLDWNAGVQLNVTIPHIEVSFANWAATTIDPKDPSVVIVNTQSAGGPEAGQAFQDIAFSLEDGRMLWNKTRDEGTWEAVVGGRSMSISDDCYTIYRKETRQIYAYSVSTGEQKWVSKPRTSQWGMYMQGINFAYGKCYCIGYDGMIYAYDAKTGKELWTWGPVSSGLETPYGVYPLYGGTVAADHKLIVSNGEHSANSPLYRGERMYVVDADNGTTLWSIDGWYQQPCVAEGIVVAPNGYDGQIYCFGKGPSATTVSIKNDVLTEGASVLIQGSVTDISAGASQNEQAKRFPNGLPCVSDESMSAWMEYVYMQQSCPANATGVEVSLDVVDANGNYRNIGTATTDANGFFSYMWKPDIPGKYTVYATFAGSNSYYRSYAETAFGVVEAPAATPEPTPEPQSAADLYFVPAVIGLLVAIIIVGALTILMLRKR